MLFQRESSPERPGGKSSGPLVRALVGAQETRVSEAARDSVETRVAREKSREDLMRGLWRQESEQKKELGFVAGQSCWSY